MEHKNLLTEIPGFIDKPIGVDHWILGSTSQLKGVALSSGHWDKEGHIPEGEPQSKPNLETFDCTGFSITNCIEILWHRVHNEWRNFSDRWVGIISGTLADKGNNPHTVAEAVRKNGLIDEVDLSFNETITTIDEFYSPDPPTQDLIDKGKSFNAEQVIQHDWVESTPESLKEALKYSPLGIAVTAWYRGADGLYYFPPNSVPNHATTLIGWEENTHWLIYDSYKDEAGSYLKKLRWDSQFQLKTKRYALGIGQKEQVTILIAIVGLWKKIIALFLEAHKPNLVEPLVSHPSPPIPPSMLVPLYDFSSPEKARHALRVICDEEGLSVDMKNKLCETVKCESSFDPNAVHHNNNGTSDFGLVQFNSRYWVGPGKPFATKEEVFSNPEKCIRLMCGEFKAGRQHSWVCYTKLYG